MHTLHGRSLVFATGAKLSNHELTVIATGFPTSETVQDDDSGLDDMLRDALENGSAELDLPPFLRRMSKYRKDGRTEVAVGR